jgi:hypothetical protein
LALWALILRRLGIRAGLLIGRLRVGLLLVRGLRILRV